MPPNWYDFCFGPIPKRIKDLIFRFPYRIGSIKYNDIALVTMDSPVQYSNILSPVCLYDDVGVNHDGKEAVAIGWGNIRDGECT